ncbi:MAG: M28 family peptidase [Blastocatellia bacterium]
MTRTVRTTLAVAIMACCLGAQRPAAQHRGIHADRRAALNRISAASLRGHLSFIASDALEGRNTPSPGLDLAAEYIAAQFRRAGLEPAGDDGYFQTASFAVVETPMHSFELKLRTGTDVIDVAANQVSFSIEKALSVSAGGFKVDYKDATALAALKPEQIDGRVIITEIPDYLREQRSRWMEMYRAQNAFVDTMTALKAALIVSIDRVSRTSGGSGASRLIDPDNRRVVAASAGVPVITVHDQRALKAFDAMKPGPSDAEVSVQVPAPVERPIKLRNVIGLLRGSDPALANTYVLLTAHYDHIGKGPANGEDHIFNGANDDGSGTVTVIEIASALARLKKRPKRSIVFMTFFGEEKGGLGSRFYSRNPAFPLNKTVADVNLEQLGRTDSSEGPQLSNASLTGFDYSEVGTIFKAAGELSGVTVYKHEQNSDSFFSRSDNQALADQGVPAHTISVTFLFPDYHGVGDHWEKIDYANMEKVDRMIALGLMMIADSPQEPRWNASNPKAARYLKAWQNQHGK